MNFIVKKKNGIGFRFLKNETFLSEIEELQNRNKVPGVYKSVVGESGTAATPASTSWGQLLLVSLIVGPCVRPEPFV